MLFKSGLIEFVICYLCQYHGNLNWNDGHFDSIDVMPNLKSLCQYRFVCVEIIMPDVSLSVRFQISLVLSSLRPSTATFMPTRFEMIKVSHFLLYNRNLGINLSIFYLLFF